MKLEDNPAMVDKLNIDKKAPKEGRYDPTSVIERKSSKVTDPCEPTVAEEDFYTDKIVTKVEDDPCCIVKDISIDEGNRSSNKSLVEKESSISKQTLDNGLNDMTNKMGGSAGSDDLNKYAVLNNPITVDDKDQTVLLHNDSDGKCSSMSSINGVGNLKVTAASNAIDEVTESRAAPVSEIDNDCNSSSVSSIDGSGKLDTDESVVSNITADVGEHQLPPSQEGAPDSRVHSYNQISYSDQKQPVDGRSNQSERLQTISEESFEAEEASTSGRDDNNEITDGNQSEVAHNGSEIKEAMIDGATSSAACSFHRLIQEESNLSGALLSSGPLVNSGRIPYSGSISLRSDSSTASARSFAFPLLQSEWNSSPVRMAKANRKKHLGWKRALRCCRF